MTEPNELQQRIVQAYDTMSPQQWQSFDAYCASQGSPTSLLSFVEYLLACADRAADLQKGPRT